MFTETTQINKAACSHKVAVWRCDRERANWGTGNFKTIDNFWLSKTCSKSTQFWGKILPFCKNFKAKFKLLARIFFLCAENLQLTFGNCSSLLPSASNFLAGAMQRKCH